MTDGPALQTLRLNGGIELAYRTAGDPGQPALVLLHGFPASSRAFRRVIEPLSQVAFVVAPDLPGFGASDVPARPSFAASTDAVEELLEHLKVGDRFLYFHDFGAPVGLDLALRAPERVAGLIAQNANAHQSGLGAQWDPIKRFWTEPTPQNTAGAMAHFTEDGIRGAYFTALPRDLAARVDPDVWREDWRVMNLRGRMQAQRALVADYAVHVARFGEISTYLARHQPPALVLWGRHDPYFQMAEVLSWLEELPRAEAHVLDGGHFLLETQGPRAAELITEFISRTRPQ